MERKESPHITARRAITEEKARISGKKKIKDRRVAALEEAAQAWQREKEEERIQEELRLEAERRRTALGVDFGKIELEDYIKGKDTDHREIEAIGWSQHPAAESTQEGALDPKAKRNLNAASIWVFARKLMAREWARALGKKLPDHRAFALEQEVRILRERREGERKRTEREKEMLNSFCQLLSDEGKFTQAKKKEWDFGGVEFLITKLKSGWNIYIGALEKSPYMRRKGWSDLLGTYKVRVNKDLNITSCNRKKDFLELEMQKERRC